MYEKLCALRADEERAFWRDRCHLPPTFQSWFTVTNLHVWLLTVRLRALPEPQGQYYLQALIDHFFLDVEDRVRAVLQPATRQKRHLPPPVASHTPDPTSELPTVQFYTVSNAGKEPKGNAPERLVTRQMKIFKEQWAGLGMAMDLGLVKGDAEMAGAVWRNLLGARGARGIIYPSSEVSKGDKPYFRRSINLVGGEVEKVSTLDKTGLEAEEAKDDGSGVHDFGPNEAALYVRYPELMADVVKYVRSELVRLEKLSDEQVMGRDGSSVDVMKFRRIRE
ncbi:hypothetical protein EW026_g6350 [Hermanssonia centrifuga]|nr:hypothetical protein EW026_g6350 [Hermanssonia centrifuga]